MEGLLLQGGKEHKLLCVSPLIWEHLREAHPCTMGTRGVGESGPEPRGLWAQSSLHRTSTTVPYGTLVEAGNPLCPPRQWGKVQSHPSPPWVAHLIGTGPSQAAKHLGPTNSSLQLAALGRSAGVHPYWAVTERETVLERGRGAGRHSARHSRHGPAAQDVPLQHVGTNSAGDKLSAGPNNTWFKASAVRHRMPCVSPD